jgi:signal transduction histidine kinase
VFDEVRELWHPRLSAEGRRLRVNTPGEVTVRGLPTLVRTVLEVLVDNAFIHGDGTVSIDFTVTQRTATVSVADEGKGFEISSEEPDPGHGRGLELADRMARSVGGRVVVANAGRGPRVEVVLLRAGFESDGTATP